MKSTFTRIALAMAAMLLLSQSSYAQDKMISISGTVTDSEKNPIPGAGVLIQGTVEGTMTDLDGHFYMNVPSKQSVIEVVCLGYKTQVLTVASKIN